MLTEWAQSMGGFLRRLSGGRFLILTDEIHIRQAMEKRFEVLDKIREIKAGGAPQRDGFDRRGARGGISARGGTMGAQSAGRRWGAAGAVAVKQKNDTYEFFGLA